MFDVGDRVLPVDPVRKCMSYWRYKNGYMVYKDEYGNLCVNDGDGDQTVFTEDTWQDFELVSSKELYDPLEFLQSLLNKDPTAYICAATMLRECFGITLSHDSDGVSFERIA